MVFIPDADNCKDSKIFDSLIQTREIKALTNFLDKSQYTNIIKYAIKIYRGEK